MTEDVSPLIAQAIDSGVKAGVFRRAARLNPSTSNVWDECADPHSNAAEMYLTVFATASTGDKT